MLDLLDLLDLIDVQVRDYLLDDLHLGDELDLISVLGLGTLLLHTLVEGVSRR